MLFPIKAVLTGCLCTGLTVAVALPQDDGTSKQFHLESIVKGGSYSSSNGLLITGVHTGAGESAAVASNNASLAETFVLDKTYIGIAGGVGTPSVPSTFNLIPATPYMSDAPDTYNIVDIDVGENTEGFSIDENSLVQYSGVVDFKGFALCNVNGTAPYFGGGPAIQLLWKNSSSVDGAPNCADVDLKADYTN